MSPTATATKTFEATLAPPTAHKERRLQRTEATYRRALRDAFDTDCTTQTAINNVATDYDLSSCAKEHSNSTSHDFDAEELVEDYPVRFTNRGWHHDHSPDRAHEFCCGHVGHRDSDEFRCTNESCWVTEYRAELNAAVNIAGCLDLWGESLPWKPASDHFPRDESVCDSTTGHREVSREPRQTILSAHSSETFSRSEPYPVGSPAVHGG